MFLRRSQILSGDHLVRVHDIFSMISRILGIFAHSASHRLSLWRGLCLCCGNVVRREDQSATRAESGWRAIPDHDAGTQLRSMTVTLD